MEDQMASPGGMAPPDPKAAFKNEWEALSMHSHHFAFN